MKGRYVGTHVVIVGGTANNGLITGTSYFNANNATSNRNRNIGSHTMHLK